MARTAGPHPLDGLSVEFLLPGQVEQVPVARAALARHLEVELGPDDPVVFTVAQVVTEAVANAIRHSASGLPGGEVQVQATIYADRIDLTVTDQGPKPGGPSSKPHVKPDSLTRQSGRGMTVIDQLCSSWEPFFGPEGTELVMTIDRSPTGDPGLALDLLDAVSAL